MFTSIFAKEIHLLMFDNQIFDFVFLDLGEVAVCSSSIGKVSP